MPEEKGVDYYEVLQVSTSAEPETINRVFRLLAQRFHPDNQTTGNEDRFRVILEAYNVLSDFTSFWQISSQPPLFCGSANRPDRRSPAWQQSSTCGDDRQRAIDPYRLTL